MLSAGPLEALLCIADLTDPRHFAQAEHGDLVACDYEPLDRLPTLLLGVQPPKRPVFLDRRNLVRVVRRNSVRV
jgi:hypothetical protein